MLKYYLFGLLFFFKTIACCGQGFNGYVFGGISASQVSGDALGGFDKAGLAFGAGVMTTVSRNDKTKIGMEIGYIQKGSRKPSKLDQGNTAYYRLRLNYIEIPLYIDYAASEKIHAYLGGSVGVLTHSLEENENGELSYGIPFNKFDVSITGGLEYLLSQQWHLNLRGLQSIAPVREFSGPPRAFFDNGQYNSVISFTINYLFKTKQQHDKS